MKTILITGATAGFGEAAARKFVAGGWRAIGTGRRGDRLKRLQNELGANFLPLEIDMLDRVVVESLARLDAPWGEIDLLLNNAGLAPPYWVRSVSETVCTLSGLAVAALSLRVMRSGWTAGAGEK